MNLLAEIKQKNERLLVENLILQQQLGARVNPPEFTAFFTTFAVIPFLAGAVIQYVFSSGITTPKKLCRTLLPGLRLWSFF
jgi:hypothetical protein